jgi:hypothetical protein
MLKLDIGNATQRNLKCLVPGPCSQGVRNPSLMVMVRLAKALDVGPGELLNQLQHGA